MIDIINSRIASGESKEIIDSFMGEAKFQRTSRPDGS
jgi:hypothetical protein